MDATNSSWINSLEDVPTPIISDQLSYWIEIFMQTGVNLVLSLFGASVNVINFIVFLRQGAKDCVGLCLLFLALSDFVFVSSVFVTNFCKLLDIFEVPTPYVELNALRFVVSYGGEMFYDLSTSMTAFISVERCLCVSLPFKFKDFVTMKRALIIIAVIYLLNISLTMPHFLTSGLVRGFDARTNSTRIVLWISPDHQKVEHITSILIHLVTASLSLLIVLISTQVMIAGLTRSAQFNTQKLTNCGEGHDKRQTQFKGGSEGAHDNAKTQKALRNKNVIRTVLTLAIICFTTNSLKLIIVIGQKVFPEVSYVGPERNLWFLLIYLSTFVQTVNASVNIFVYYSFNNSFRITFRDIFRCFFKNID